MRHINSTTKVKTYFDLHDWHDLHDLHDLHDNYQTALFRLILPF